MKGALNRDRMTRHEQKLFQAFLCRERGGPDGRRGRLAGDSGEHCSLPLGPRPADRHARHFIAWGKARGEDPMFLGQRWDRFQALPRQQGHLGSGHHPAFLLTPREEFSAINSGDPQARLRARLPRHRLRRHHVRPAHPGSRRPTSSTSLRARRCSEIGTGSGVQSAYIANLTENAYIDRDHRAARPHPRPLRQTDREGPHRVQAHQTRRPTATTAGEEAAPFDKIIVTCGIDPPPLPGSSRPAA